MQLFWQFCCNCAHLITDNFSGSCCKFYCYSSFAAVCFVRQFRVHHCALCRRFHCLLFADLGLPGSAWSTFDYCSTVVSTEHIFCGLFEAPLLALWMRNPLIFQWLTYLHCDCAQAIVTVPKHEAWLNVTAMFGPSLQAVEFQCCAVRCSLHCCAVYVCFEFGHSRIL